MSDEETRNTLKYLGGMLIGAVAAGLAVLVVQLGSNDPLTWRPILAACLGPIVTGLTAMQLPRFGSAQLSTQVDVYRTLGYHRRDLTIVPKSGATPDTSSTDVGV